MTTHATKHAIAAASGALTSTEKLDAAPLSGACGSPETASFWTVEVYGLLSGEPVDLPTCPACAVLLDEALERRRE